MKSENKNEKFHQLLERIGQLLPQITEYVESIDPRYANTILEQMPAVLQQTLNENFSQQDVLCFLQEAASIAEEPSTRTQIENNLFDVHSNAIEKGEQDPRYSSLMNLISEASQQVPNCGLLVPLRHKPPELFRRVSESLIQLAALKKSPPGEPLARTALQAIHTVSEQLYHPYLQTVWYFTCIRDRKRVTTPSMFGSLLSETQKRVPTLVEEKAAWLRNAYAHADWKYSSQRDSVQIPNKDELKTDELRNIAFDMFQMSGIILQHVLETCTFQIMIECGIVEDLIKIISIINKIETGAEQEVIAAQQRMSEKLLGPLIRYLEIYS